MTIITHATISPPEHGAQHGAVDGAVGRSQAPVAPSAPCPPMKSGGHGGITPARAGTRRIAHGAHHGAEHGAPQGALPARFDAASVIARLEEAGETLMALPASGPGTGLRTSTLDIVRTAAESYGWTSGRLRPPTPPAARITRMDETLAWLALIPDDRYVLRRIVSSRMLVSPTTGRHLFPWRRLGLLLGADHKAIQRWHAQGIDLLVAALNRASK